MVICFLFKDKLFRISTNVYFHAVENSDILNWTKRLKIAVDAAHGNVLFIEKFFLHRVPLHST
jgi:hypothetical protein